MSEMTLDNFPVELIYRIFDNLDAKTILVYVRYVCRRFYTIVNNYNLHTIDFRSITMVDFHILCKMIIPENIKKLILSNDEKTIGLIKMFLTKYNLEQFRNLRYLILSHIEDHELEISLKQLENHSLNILSIVKFDLYDNKEVKHHLLSSVITRPNLRKLDLEFRLADIKDFPWPMECPIEYLRIGNTITFNQFYKILEQTHFLKIFILKDCSNKESNQFPFKSFKQLNSLTFEQTRMDIDHLKLILSYTPSLNYLKLIGTKDLSNGFYLEEIIEKSLPLLKIFHFYFDSWENPTYEQDFQTIILPYQSPFWIEQKHWFINCDYLFDQSPKMRLYSLPLCYHKLEFYSDQEKSSFTTLDQTDPNLMIMDSVRQLTIDLNRTIPQFEHRNNIQIPVIFVNVTELKLLSNEKWRNESFDFLSSLINLSNLNSFSLIVAENCRLNGELIQNICLLLRKTPNVQTLSITGGQSPLSSKITLEQIFEIVPNHVKHLQVMVKDFDEIRMIIDTLTNLSSIKFQIVRVMARSFSDNRPSITQIREGSTCQKMDPHLQMWLGKTNTNIINDH